jgi:predicted metal-dependent hydrolase
MERALLAGSPPVEVELRRSARARRYTLRVSKDDGRVTLTLPLRGSEPEALAFARSRTDWVRRALASLAPVQKVAPGMRLPVEGVLLELVAAPVRSARREGGALLVPQGPQAGRHAAAWLRLLARERLASACDAHAATLGRPYARLALRDPRARWGSCSAAGNLMFSWRLAMAPPDVLDYVAAHEVAHLAEMNHSPRFWAVVARLVPDYQARRRWLRAEGAGLHRFVFPA